MICVSIRDKGLEEIRSVLEGNDPHIEMAEIRLDLCPLDLEGIRELFSYEDTPLVATCRIPGDKGDGTKAFLEAEDRLCVAVEAGAQYVDLEVEAPPSSGKRLRKMCSSEGTILIRSYHDYSGTGTIEELKSVMDKCFKFGADVVKIVTTAHCREDVDRVMSLYRFSEPGRLIAFCMGEPGRDSRLQCLGYGAPYTYAALEEEEAVAPGQWPVREMYDALYGGRCFRVGGKPVAMPSSKSFAQRAIIAAALSGGESRLEGYSPCGDNESALAVAREIGAGVSLEGGTLTIEGISAAPGCLDVDSLHVGESGFLTRMMIPLMSVLNDRPVKITGEKTLLRRPLKGAADIMASFGVLLSSGEAPGEIHVPLTVSVPAIPGRAEISGKDGSQLISGLLSALPLGDRDSTVYVTDPKSVPYMFITIDVLRKFGIKIGSEMEGDEDFMETNDWNLCTGVNFKIKGGQRYKPAEFTIEGDWSSAANFLVAGAIFGEADIVGLDTTSLQADLSILDILAQAGASVSQVDEKDHRGLIHIQKAPLSAFEVDANNCPDLFPIVSVLAAFCEGTSRISGTGRLSGKESDRGKAIIDMLQQLGVASAIEGDTLEIEGRSLSRRLLTRDLLHGGSFTSHHDHRMVMALKVASLGADSPVEIDDTACVSKSFPHFLSLFDEFADDFLYL